MAESSVKLNDNCRIGFIGAGNMATSIVKGFLKKGVKPENIWAVAPTQRNLHSFAELRCHTASEPNKLFENCASNENTEFFIFLCTKPKTPFVTKGFWNFLESAEYRKNTSRGGGCHIISVMAGIETKVIEHSIAGKFAKHHYVSRIMPNLGCEVNASPISLCQSACLVEKTQANLRSLLECLGPLIDLPEPMLDTAVGISGSGLGFYCTFLQALADGAVADGLSRDEAIKLGAQTAIALGKLVLETGKHPIVLRDLICSPAGTTIQGVQTLEQGGFSSLVMNTVKDSSARSREIAAILNQSIASNQQSKPSH